MWTFYLLSLRLYFVFMNRAKSHRRILYTSPSGFTVYVLTHLTQLVSGTPTCSTTTSNSQRAWPPLGLRQAAFTPTSTSAHDATARYSRACEERKEYWTMCLNDAMRDRQNDHNKLSFLSYIIYEHMSYSALLSTDANYYSWTHIVHSAPDYIDIRITKLFSILR